MKKTRYHRTTLPGHSWKVLRQDGSVIGYYKNSNEARVVEALNPGSQAVFLG